MDKYISSLIQQIQQRWHESPMTKGGFGAQSRPQSDPFNQLPMHLMSLGTQSRVAAGFIVDVVPRAHCYKVAIENGRSYVAATPLSATTFSEVGAKSIGLLQIGTRVMVLLHPQMRHGLIIGAEPPFSASVGAFLPDAVAQTSRTYVDTGLAYAMQLFPNKEIVDWSAGRPVDGLPGYEQGWMGATGTKITIDDFLVQMAVNEYCGVFGFYHDSLLRIAGMGLQLWAANSEQEWLTDSGEAYEYHGSTPYAWEQAGRFTPSGNDVTVRGRQDYQVNEPEYCRWEPSNPNAKAFHRTQRFGGYLGQGLHEFVVLPPTDGQLYTYGEGSPLASVYERSVALDGRLAVRSSKGIVITKRLKGVCPRQLKRPEDPNGDTTENYKFAGVIGNGPDQQITGDISADGSIPSLQRAAGVLDLHAYIFNYQGVHPFHFHTKDWELPEESALDGSNQKLPQFGELAGKMYLSSPQPIKRTVDDRYGEQDYYQTESALSLLDDGAVILYDGYGSELKQVAGSQFLSAPGDIWIKAGRNIHLWAGGSIDIRAKDSIDLSTSTNDIRIKSERNLLTLSGNSGRGGTLIESRGAGSNYDFSSVGEPSFGGIALQASEGQLSTWSSSLYARTTSGNITLDANRGQANLLVNANSELHALGRAVEFAYGQPEAVTAVHAFSSNGVVLAGGLNVGGGAALYGGLVTNSSITVLNGHIATQFAKSAQYRVGGIAGNDLTKAETSMGDLNTQITETIPQATTNAYKAAFTDGLYADNRAGNDATIEESQFTFRTDVQYNVPDFLLYEDRWQHLAKVGGAAIVAWNEPAVESAVGTTYPFPGQKAFEGDTFYQQKDKLVDGTTGDALDRTSEDYTSPSFDNATPTTLQNYPVIS